MNKLMLGVARELITPEVGGMLFGYNLNTFSTSINDDLEVTVFAFCYENTKVLMINATVCLVCNSICDKIRRELSDTINIPFENILISATHTHSGPSLADPADGFVFDEEYYKNIFYPAVITAAKKAAASPEPVTVGCASGKCYAGVNRRQLTTDNRVILGQNPWAPFNPEMNVISFKNESGKVIANIISYSAHATAAGGNHEVTRDWPGVMTDAIEELSGGLTAFFNGTMGDSGPRLSNGRTSGFGDIAYVKEMGDIAAKDATDIYNSIKEYVDVSFAAVTGIIKLPLKPRISKQSAEEYLKTADKNPDHIGGFIKSYYQKVLHSYEIGYEEKEYREISQTLVRIGNVVFAPFPFEMFSEIGLRIDAAVSDFKVITLSYTNGQMLYLPTEDQLCRGGHEVHTFRYSHFQQYADNTDYHLIKGTLDNILSLK